MQQRGDKTLRKEAIIHQAVFPTRIIAEWICRTFKALGIKYHDFETFGIYISHLSALVSPCDVRFARHAKPYHLDVTYMHKAVAIINIGTDTLSTSLSIHTVSNCVSPFSIQNTKSRVVSQFQSPPPPSPGGRGAPFLYFPLRL